MPKARSQAAAELTPQQEACCREWRDLCQALERAQGEDLNQNCRDKYQFAKTYMVFGRDLAATIDDVRARLAQGNASFFTERGAFCDEITAEMAELMLRDWSDAVAAKKQHAAFVFHNKFGRQIDDFVGTNYQALVNTTKMASARPLFASDAIVLMSELPKAAPDPEPVPLGREQVVAVLADELNQLAAVRDEVAQLRADMQRVLKKLGIERE